MAAIDDLAIQDQSRDPEADEPTVSCVSRNAHVKLTE